MKNYEKIYKTLIKEIKRMKQQERNCASMEHEPIMKEVEKRESSYAITTMDCILEMADEIDGTKHHNAIMNKEEFELNRSKINGKV